MNSPHRAEVMIKSSFHFGPCIEPKLVTDIAYALSVVAAA